MQEIQTAPIRKHVLQAEFVELECSDNCRLKRFVNTQWKNLPNSRWSVAWRDFTTTVVDPCVHTPTRDVSAPVVLQARSFAKCLTAGKLSTMEELNIKLGARVASGALNGHPMVQGILVAVVEMAAREQRGASTMKGLKLSDLEMSSMAEAGLSLSLAAKNPRLMKAFGLQWTVPRLPLSNLHGKSLPEPFLSMAQGNILKTNFEIISELLTCKPDSGHASSNRRCLTLALDRTYILQGVQA